MENSEKFKALLIGFLAGGIAGSVLSLLYAPSSGKKLRRKITDKTEDLIDEAEEFYETKKEKAEEIIKEGKKKASEIIEDAKKKIKVN